MILISKTVSAQKEISEVSFSDTKLGSLEARVWSG